MSKRYYVEETPDGWAVKDTWPDSGNRANDRNVSLSRDQLDAYRVRNALNFAKIGELGALTS